MVAEDPQTVPRTTHIELLRDYKKRKKQNLGQTQTNGETKERFAKSG